MLSDSGAASARTALDGKLRPALLLIAAAAFGYLALSLWAGWREVLAASARAGVGVVLGLLGLSLLNYLLRGIRWRHYLGLLGVAPPLATALRIYCAGFALTITPGKLGELLRGWLLKPHGVSLMASAAAFFAERAMDLLTIVLLCGLVFQLYPAGAPLILAAGGVVVCAVIAVQSPRWIHAIDAWAGRFHGRWARGLCHLCRLVLDFRRCFTPATLLYALLIGVVAWGAEAVGFHWLLLSLGYALPLSMSVFIYSFAMLAGGVSFLPGGIGGSELVMVGLLVWQGVPEPVAVSATLITRLATLWFAVALGGLALASLRRRVA